MDAEFRLTLAYFQSHPLEAAKQLETWPALDVATVLSPFSSQDMVPVLEHFPSTQAATVLELLPQDKTVEIITLFPTASAIRILRLVNQSVRNDLLARLDQHLGPSLRLSMAYPDGTAGNLADPRVLILPPDLSVSAALQRIRRDPIHSTYYHYVVERDGSLVGLVTTKELLVADPDRLMATVMNDQVAAVAAEAAEGELLQNPHWRLYHTLPVVDRQGHFLGALRYRTLRRIEEQLEVRPTAGPLPQALVQMWEAYALVGLHIMTDLATAIETGASENMPMLSKKSEETDVTSPETS